MAVEAQCYAKVRATLAKVRGPSPAPPRSVGIVKPSSPERAKAAKLSAGQRPWASTSLACRSRTSRATASAFASQGFFIGFSSFSRVIEKFPRNAVPQFEICNLHSAICICHSSFTLRVGLSTLTRRVSEDVRQLQIANSTDLRILQGQGTETISPTARVPKARKVTRSIDDSINRTEPSAMANCTPPGCALAKL